MHDTILYGVKDNDIAFVSVHELINTVRSSIEFGKSPEASGNILLHYLSSIEPDRIFSELELG